MTRTEEKFAAAWNAQWDNMEALGISAARMRQQSEKLGPITLAQRILSGRKCSDGFHALQKQNRLDLTLEALCLQSVYGELFTDEQANEALNRLMEAGYCFR